MPATSTRPAGVTRAPAGTHPAGRPQGAKARYATPRNPKARTIGTRIGIVAGGMGKAFMPWQCQVADVAGELDAFGGLRYEIVLVTVPRQSGKTTLVGPVQIDRCVTNPDAKVFYTAQTGKDARSRFTDLVKLVKRSPLEAMARFRYSAGDEGILWPNGSAQKIFAPTESAIHGETPPLVTLDEIWELDESLGDAMLEDAILPAQITLAGNRQVWMISTAGTALSTFMKKWVARGRAQVKAQLAGETGPHPKLAYFEWSMPDGADPYDPEVLAGFHPAVGFTITVEDLLEAAKNTSRAKWLRSFCNVWLEASNPIMSLDDWDALAADPLTAPRRNQIVVTYDVAPDNETTAVMATWKAPAGPEPDAPLVTWCRVLHAAPGTHWAVDLLEKLHREWKPLAMGADDGGPTRVVTDELRRRLKDTEKTKVLTLGARDFDMACAAWLRDARENKTIRHDGSRTLRHGIAHMALKEINASVRISRADSTGPVAGQIAGAVGAWLFDHRPAPLGAPELRF